MSPRRSQAVAAWVLALPFVLLFLAFTAGPVLASLGMSFTDFRRADMRSPLAVEFAKAGYRVIGFDVSERVCSEIEAGRSHIQDGSSDEVAARF